MSVANFTPAFTDYSGPGAFKYWVQNTLPLVFDDSLSYYEVLSKVVTYLNQTIEAVKVEDENIRALRDAYIQLETYLNEWTDNLDVESVISQKLDQLVADGTFTEQLVQALGQVIKNVKVIGTANMEGVLAIQQQVGQIWQICGYVGRVNSVMIDNSGRLQYMYVSPSTGELHTVEGGQLAAVKSVTKTGDALTVTTLDGTTSTITGLGGSVSLSIQNGVLKNSGTTVGMVGQVDGVAISGNDLVVRQTDGNAVHTALPMTTLSMTGRDLYQKVGSNAREKVETLGSVVKFSSSVVTSVGAQVDKQTILEYDTNKQFVSVDHDAYHEKHVCVCFGDSYGEVETTDEGAHASWVFWLRQFLNQITGTGAVQRNWEVRNYCKSGFGWNAINASGNDNRVNTSNAGSFYAEVATAVSQMNAEARMKVDTVIVAGGWNDVAFLKNGRVSWDVFGANVDATIKYILTSFPNAKIYVAPLLMNDKAISDDQQSVLYRVSSSCSNLPVVQWAESYLWNKGNFEWFPNDTSMHRNNGTLHSDGVHPNVNGCKRIASMMYSGLNGGSTSVNMRKSFTVGKTNTTKGLCTLQNGMITVCFNGNIGTTSGFNGSAGATTLPAWAKPSRRIEANLILKDGEVKGNAFVTDDGVLWLYDLANNAPLANTDYRQCTLTMVYPA